MREYGFLLTRILPYKDRIVNSVLIQENMVSENQYSRIFYAVDTFVSKISSCVTIEISHCHWSETFSQKLLFYLHELSFVNPKHTLILSIQSFNNISNKLFLHVSIKRFVRKNITIFFTVKNSFFKI